MIGRAGAAALIALLGACVTASPYQARTEPAGAGYTDERLGEARWSVEYAGGAGDSRETVETYLLYRAAELTARNGYDWFVSSDHAIDTETDVVVEAQRVRESPAWRPQWRRKRSLRWTDWMPAGAEPSQPSMPPAAQAVQRERYAAREVIVMGRGAAPSGAFEARRVLAEFAPTISRRE